MNFFKALLCVATLLLAFMGQSEAAKVRVRWSPKYGVSVAMPKSKGYRFDRAAKKLYVCSGDYLNFYWSGETAGMHMFGGRTSLVQSDLGKQDYDTCTVDRNINFLKTENSAGSFNTKANNKGWRYYAYIPGLGKQDTKGGKGCKLKLAVYWSQNC